MTNTIDSYIITQAYKDLRFGLFVEQPKKQYSVMNKWTGETLGVFNSFEEALEAVRAVCK